MGNALITPHVFRKNLILVEKRFDGVYYDGGVYLENEMPASHLGSSEFVEFIFCTI